LQFLARKSGREFGSTNLYTYGSSDRTELAATIHNIDNAVSPELALGLGFKIGRSGAR
jgi:hypothetical protein